MILSILIPSIPSRLESHLMPLVRELMKQSENVNFEIEVLVLTDNKHRSIGAKRQALLNLAQGTYIAFVDDDDRIELDYLHEFSQVLFDVNYFPDVITFKQRVIMNGEPYELTFKHGHEVNEELSSEGCTRPTWHVCFWRREIVKHCTFPDSNYGEDWAWAEQANKKAKTSHHIDRFMMTYVYDKDISEATI